MNHLRENQNIVMLTARQMGLSDIAGRVLAANFSGESLANPWLRGWDIKQYSQGIAQWSQDRADRIRAHFGKFPKDMPVAGQVEAFLWEAKTHYPKTWKAINNKDMTPERMLEIIVRDFERPKYPLRAVRERMKMYAAIRPIPPPKKDDANAGK